jgi:hypothetical protein
LADTSDEWLNQNYVFQFEHDDPAILLLQQQAIDTQMAEKMDEFHAQANDIQAMLLDQHHLQHQQQLQQPQVDHSTAQQHQYQFDHAANQQQQQQQQSHRQFQQPVDIYNPAALPHQPLQTPQALAFSQPIPSTTRPVPSTSDSPSMQLLSQQTALAAAALIASALTQGPEAAHSLLSSILPAATLSLQTGDTSVLQKGQEYQQQQQQQQQEQDQHGKGQKRRRGKQQVDRKANPSAKPHALSLEHQSTPAVPLPPPAPSPVAALLPPHVLSPHVVASAVLPPPSLPNHPEQALQQTQTAVLPRSSAVPGLEAEDEEYGGSGSGSGGGGGFIDDDDDKRKRNTAASARFRLKKKLKEQSLEHTVMALTSKLQYTERRLTGWCFYYYYFALCMLTKVCVCVCVCVCFDPIFKSYILD